MIIGLIIMTMVIDNNDQDDDWVDNLQNNLNASRRSGIEEKKRHQPPTTEATIRGD